jgi:hypothetical protein
MMADDPLASFALGCFAASRGASDLAALSVSLFAPKNDVVSLADYQALAEVCAYLQAKVEELEDDVAREKRNVEHYRLWGRELYDEVAALKTK